MGLINNYRSQKCGLPHILFTRGELSSVSGSLSALCSEAARKEIAP